MVRDLVDTEEIKKRWKEYTEELYKKYLNEQDYCDDVVSYPEPDILECEVKWTLRSTAVNKVSVYDEIPTELFKSLKDDAIKVLHSYVSKSRKPRGDHRTGKGQSSFQSPRRVVPKNVLTIGQLISLASKVMLKILHARLQHYVNQELPNVQVGFRKEEVEIKLPAFTGL